MGSKLAQAGLLPVEGFSSLMPAVKHDFFVSRV